MNKRLPYFLLLAGTLIFPACKKVTKEIKKTTFPALIVNTNILDIEKVTADSINITPYLEMYIGDVSIKDSSFALQKKFWRKCGELLSPDIFPKRGDRWFRFTVQNNTAFAFSRLVCFNNLDYAALYYSAQKIEKAGTIVPTRDWSYPANNNCLVLSLNANEAKTFFIRCNKGNASGESSVRFILRSEQNEKSFESFEMRSRMADTVFLFFYLGFLFFCFIYFIAQYIFRLNEKILIVYSLYILFTLLYSFRDIDKHYFLQTAFPAFNGINIWGEAIFSYVAYIFYSLFVVYLLDLRKEKKGVFLFIVSVIGIISFLFLCDVILRISGQQQYALELFLKSRVVLFPLTIAYFILIIISPFDGKYYSYFLYGSVFLVIGTGANLLVYFLRDNPEFIFHKAISSRYSFWGNPVNYTRMGVMTEVLFFSMGLAKKMRMEFAEALSKEGFVIMNSFYMHGAKDSLYILEGGKLKTKEEIKYYISLYRDYLENALEQMEEQSRGIELSKEIASARSYFAIKNAKNEKYIFHFDKAGIDPDKILIPPGLLAPFVQNFFRHAITNGPDKFSFELSLCYENGKINLDITDNGKGFNDSAIFNKSQNSGLNIARRQVKLFNTLSGSRLDFTLTQNKSGKGTLIKIKNLPPKNVI